MNGILLFVIGAIVGAIALVIISCIAVGSDETSHDKQFFDKQPFDFYGLSCILFITLVYYMSNNLGKETVINYITNAIKIGTNKGLIEFKKNDVRANECAESLYECVMETFKEGDV